MERYVLASHDPSEKFLQEVFISLMVSDDTFAESRVRYSDTGFLKRIDKLAGHTSTTANMQYGVTHSNSLLLSVQANNIDIRISLEWHRILGLCVKGVKSFN